MWSHAGAFMVQKNPNLLWGLLLLRLGLGIFLAMCAIDKLVAPEIAINTVSQFYFLDINTSFVMIIGGILLALSLLIILGMYKTITYGLGLLIHIISMVATYEQLLSPFGKNHLFIASIPIFFSFLALFLLREFDTKLSLGKKKSLFA